MATANTTSTSNTTFSSSSGENNYTTATKPQPASLSIPEGGLTKEQADIQIRKLDNQSNAWRVKTAEANVELQKATAYKTTYNAVKAGIGAAIAYVGAETEWFRYVQSNANKKMVESDASLAESMVPLHLRKNQATLEKVNFEVNKLEIEVRSLGENAGYAAAVKALEGAA